MPFRDLSRPPSPLYDDFRGLPQVDFQRVGRKLASACLPNGRIDHDVIQEKLAERGYSIIPRETESYISVSASGPSRIRLGRKLSFRCELSESVGFLGYAGQPWRYELLLHRRKRIGF